MSYGNYAYGTTPYKFEPPLTEEMKREIQDTHIGIMQRYPTGRAFNGKLILAVEKAFAKVFAKYKQQIKQIPTQEFLFWGFTGEIAKRWEILFELDIDTMNKEARIATILERFSNKPSENQLNLFHIENKLKNLGFLETQLFYFTGKREITQPEYATNTYFGNPESVFGGRQQTGANLPQNTHKAQFGANIFTGLNPKEFEFGKSLNGGLIDFACIAGQTSLFPLSEKTDNHDVEIWNLIDNNRNKWSKIFYVGGQGDFLQPLEFQTLTEYNAFRKYLLSFIPFGMFAILNVNIINENE